MTRLLVMALTSATLAFLPLGAPAAHANDRNVARALAGLAVLGIIGAAVTSNKKQDKKRDEQVRRDRHWDNGDLRNQFIGRKKNRRQALPNECLNRIETRRGAANVYGKRCLERNFRQVRRLPDSCEGRVFAFGRNREVFSARCLRREGWTVARR